MIRFEYIESQTLAGAAKVATEKGGVIRAGGVDVQDLLKEHLIEPQAVVSIRRVPDLTDIREENGTIILGARATLASLARSPILLNKVRSLARAAGDAASPQIRNQATVVGNLLQRPRCWYFRNELLVCSRKGGPECLAQEGENRYHAIFGNKNCAIVHPSNLAPALMVLDAKLNTITAKGEKRTRAVAELFVTPEIDIRREHVLDPGEMVETITIPAAVVGASGTSISEFAAVREKQSFDWPLVAAAVRLAVDGGVVKDAKIVLGAVCPVPLRREAAEKALVGQKLSEASARLAATVAFEGATPLAHNAYKVPMGVALLTRAILSAGGIA